jgi:phage host-nuclease inhibitor protein Gam
MSSGAKEVERQEAVETERVSLTTSAKTKTSTVSVAVWAWRTRLGLLLMASAVSTMESMTPKVRSFGLS